MYARFVSAHMAPGDFELATSKLDKEVIPMLKKQKGFKDEVAFFNDKKEEAFAISFWDSKADFDRYEKELFPKIRETMGDTFGEEPRFRTFEVTNSTWYDIHPR